MCTSGCQAGGMCCPDNQVYTRNSEVFCCESVVVEMENGVSICPRSKCDWCQSDDRKWVEKCGWDDCSECKACRVNEQADCTGKLSCHTYSDETVCIAKSTNGCVWKSNTGKCKINDECKEKISSGLKCEDWCESNTSKWVNKCRWTNCNYCKQCRVNQRAGCFGMLSCHAITNRDDCDAKSTSGCEWKATKCKISDTCKDAIQSDM